MDIAKIKNWKEHPKVLELKAKLENKKVRDSLRWIFELAVTLVFAALVAVLMFQTVTMQESSMEPTLAVGDRFFMNQAVYKFSSPQRGDLIVFRTNASDDAALHIRRVIRSRINRVIPRLFPTLQPLVRKIRQRIDRVRIVKFRKTGNTTRAVSKIQG